MEAIPNVPRGELFSEVDVVRRGGLALPVERLGRPSSRSVHPLALDRHGRWRAVTKLVHSKDRAGLVATDVEVFDGTLRELGILSAACPGDTENFGSLELATRQLEITREGPARAPARDRDVQVGPRTRQVAQRPIDPPILRLDYRDTGLGPTGEDLRDRSLLGVDIASAIRVVARRIGTVQWHQEMSHERRQ